MPVNFSDLQLAFEFVSSALWTGTGLHASQLSLAAAVVTPYRAGARTQNKTPDAGEKLQLAVGADLEGGGLLVLGTRSGEFQQMRAGQTLARIETSQSNEAGYGVVELKIGAVPAEGGRSDDQHRRGVDPIDHKGPPLCRETPHSPQCNQSECRKPDADRNQSDAAHHWMLSPRFRLQFCPTASDYDSFASKAAIAWPQ